MTAAKKAFKPVHPMKPEYAVYIYHRPTNENDINNKWERKSVTSDLRRAKLKAKQLNKTHKYDRVELQRTSYDEDHQCLASKVLRTYGEEEDLERHLIQVAAIAMAAMGFVAAVAGVFAFF